MKVLRAILNSLLPAQGEADYHFHDRSGAPEVCFDSHCEIPRLDV